MKHKEAQDTIIRSGNNIELVVQRGGVRVWKPTVTPVGDIPSVTPTPAGTFTKTSLAANKQEFQPIGSKHNVKPKPFAQLGGGKTLVNNQYNTPVPIYSMNNIAETLSAHTEVLSSGAKGINFMKEPQPVNKDSAVYKMILEEEKSDKTNDLSVSERIEAYQRESSQQSVTQHVSAPVTKPKSLQQKALDANNCPECGKPIIGVFVRIKEKSMHPECFRCSTCGTSLKNIGYYNVNDKLYCDMHAKMVARITSASPTVEPLQMSMAEEKAAHAPVAPITPVSPPPPPESRVTPTSPTRFHTISPVSFHSTKPPSQTPVAPLIQSTKPLSQTPVAVAPTPLVPISSITSPVGAGPPGSSKFVWPPKNAPSDNVPVPNPAPLPHPSYRPPPGTQHVAATPKSNIAHSFLSSVTQQKTTSFTPAPPAPKTVPSTSPKPHTPVQSFMSPSPGNPSWASTTISSTTSSVSSSSTGLMTAGTGSRPAPRRGRGQLKTQAGAGARIPICAICGTPIRGPFVTAIGKTWCPDHFLCANNKCRRPLAEIGFVEDQGQLYCESCYETYLAPLCAKCHTRIKGDCLNALDKQWHPDCFLCAYCHKPFGNSSFYMEDALPYCEKDWNELFTTKCVGCGFPIEAGDRWVEALNNNYHSQCFKCMVCHKNLEGQSFYAKGGRPFCKTHAR